MGELSLGRLKGGRQNRAFSSLYFLPLFWDFDNWPLNREWPLNGGSTVFLKFINNS